MDASLAPSWMAKLGVVYRAQVMSVGVFDNYFATPTPVSEVNPSVREVNPSAQAYHLLSTNVELDIRKLFGKADYPEIAFSFYADNVLDEDIYYPEFNRRLINSIPLYSGRALYATLKVKL